MGGKTSNASKAKYNAKAYDRMEIVVNKGEKEVVKSHAAGQGESLNAFVNRAIIEAMQRDNEKGTS